MWFAKKHLISYCQRKNQRNSFFNWVDIWFGADVDDLRGDDPIEGLFVGFLWLLKVKGNVFEQLERNEISVSVCYTTGLEYSNLFGSLSRFRVVCFEVQGPMRSYQAQRLCTVFGTRGSFIAQFHRVIRTLNCNNGLWV